MKAALLKKLPSLVASDEKGNLFDIPEYGMMARSGGDFILPERESIIPLPYGSDLHMLPNRYPVGIDRRTGERVTLKKYRGMRLFAASAFLAPAHTALYLSAYEKASKAGNLPLFAYTALGFEGNDFVVTALRVDSDGRQDCQNFDEARIARGGEVLLERYKDNRLATHLVKNCAFTYHCPAARNWVLGRWEAPIPVSVGCNSECRGCISKQPEESGVPSTQDRLIFVPTLDEILDYTVPHLECAESAIVSFGQGCEGEPLTQASLIEESVREMRKKTTRGTINLNTNASIPHAVERICSAGIDSIRVSMNSVQKGYYDAYFRPRGYTIEDVLESMQIARRYGVWISINYFIYPGFTDSPDELEGLRKLLEKTPADMIQMRNLNMDPDQYWHGLGLGSGGSKVLGIARWMEEVRKARPGIRFGYFNPPLERKREKK